MKEHVNRCLNLYVQGDVAGIRERPGLTHVYKCATMKKSKQMEGTMGICYVVAAMKTNCEINKKAEDMVIAADGGYGQIRGCEPDYVVGDFDSLGYVPREDNVIQYPVQKDDTDMLLAVKIGLEKGYKQFVLMGGLGGRLDHSLANVQVLAYLKKQGAGGVLKSDTTDVYLIQNESLTFSEDVAGKLAVFSYGEEARGVTIAGAEYELTEGILKDTFPIGVSNSFIGKETTIGVKNGRLLVVHEKTGF